MFAPRYRLKQTIRKIAFFVEPNFRLAANICRLIPAASILLDCASGCQIRLGMCNSQILRRLPTGNFASSDCSFKFRQDGTQRNISDQKS
jgi:hypothetical protein